MTTRTLTCEQFEGALGDHLDGGTSGAERTAVDAHAAACAACAALLAGIRSIVDEAQALPELAPSRDLWASIEARISAPVIPLAAAAVSPGAPGAPRRRAIPAGRRPPAWAWGSAAAAALVLATAGITWQATKRFYETPAATAVASLPTATPAAGTDSLPGSPDAPPTAVAVAAPAPRATTGAPGGAVDRAPTVRERGTPLVVPASARAAGTAGVATYDAEIARLRAALEQRRAELDPATVAILEHNLDVIDQAIAQSRAALARDPADRFLSEQLNATLDKKVELLRTAAMLPART